jgi:hypothetical protein
VEAARALTVDSLEEVAEFRRRLSGAIGYSKQADISAARRLEARMKSGDHFILGRLASANVTRSKRWWVKNKKRDRAAELTNRWRSECVRDGARNVT